MASTEGEKQEHAPEQNKPEQVEEEGEIAGEPNAEDHQTPQESKQTQEEHKSSSGSPEKSAETGLNHEDTQQQVPSYKWCKCFFDPGDPTLQNFYFMHFDTRQTQYEEPNEPYWIWDAMLNNVHASGLQYPTTTQQTQTASADPAAEQSKESESTYQGYNPKIHGSYDPNAPYAQFHEPKKAQDPTLDEYSAAAYAAAGDYGSTGAFNRFTGRFQNADQSTDRHSDFQKSGRQLNAFFDVDAAANSHEGRSLKEERRGQKLSKKEIQEMNKKRKEKKEKKRMDFYRA
ncbi:hypothetical protein D0867_06088 [Hortaea werneckii]|uniref:WW domain-containing protein n=1 Tax=Hortaea werneckii TaxID=91943 RepID=A0A3M7AV02_HORWE|nr:hypothetical protein D0868_13659 [Hortaea werneckii]RMY17356.1 hypothetical protein D0867_06088 [Hortaea werneckii]RMY31238.1 hypothetical protein D0866_07432 [Hortaea werneckii]